MIRRANRRRLVAAGVALIVAGAVGYFVSPRAGVVVLVLLLGLVLVI